MAKSGGGPVVNFVAAVALSVYVAHSCVQNDPRVEQAKKMKAQDDAALDQARKVGLACRLAIINKFPPTVIDWEVAYPTVTHDGRNETFTTTVRTGHDGRLHNVACFVDGDGHVKKVTIH